MISVCFQGKSFNITVIQVYAPTTNAESWSWTILWRPIRPSRTNTQKRWPFHHRGLECKSSKSRDTWNNRQTWPWSTKWSRAKDNWVLPRVCIDHSKHRLPSTQEMTLYLDITRWSILKSILFAAEDGETLNSQQKHVQELTLAQIMNSLLQNSDIIEEIRENH